MGAADICNNEQSMLLSGGIARSPMYAPRSKDESGTVIPLRA
jgi:hypothetical protein